MELPCNIYYFVFGNRCKKGILQCLCTVHAFALVESRAVKVTTVYRCQNRSWSVDNLILLHVMVNRCEKAEFHDGIEAVLQNSFQL